MRLLPEGPDIPDALLDAQERGRTVFICGAGVSVGAGLPLFRGLVERVYEFLHEDWRLHIAEKEGMDPTGDLYGQYDRVVRSLERRLAASHSSRSRGMRERIRAAVRAALKPLEGADLTSHLALLELSRDEEGRNRILTTNFDTLFERAWFEDRGAPIVSHAGVAMPQPKVVGFEGVLHIHGRLADENQALSLTETDLVLTSAEFGDAYLRTGWASRYIYDLVRAHTVVLVGYKADDPPMRYLLEALEADRSRYPDLQPVYSFAPSRPGDEERQRALWHAKGVEPVVYASPGEDHSALYASIQEWRSYAADPTSWRREKLRPIFAAGISSATAATITECVGILSHGDATKILGDLSPDPHWLAVLDERKVLVEDGTHPGEWISSRINDADMIRASAGLRRLDRTTRWYVSRALAREKDAISPVRQKAWRLMLSEHRQHGEIDVDDSWFAAAPLIKGGMVGYEARRLLARVLKPRLHVEKRYSFDERRTEERSVPEELGDLVRLDFEAAKYPPPADLLAAWPEDLPSESALLGTLARSLADALDEAADVGFLQGYDRASADVPSVALHKQNRYGTGFYPIVRTIADLWTRVAAKNVEVARLNTLEWARSPYRLHQRLWFFALAHSAFSNEEVLAALSGLDDRAFWGSQGRVEMMRVVVNRWATFDSTARADLEGRMRLGVPREMYGKDAFADEDEWQSVSDDSIYRRLKRIDAGGGTIDATSISVLAAIQARHPKWVPGPDDRDDFGTWSESSSGPSGHPELLADVADERLVSEAMRLERERYGSEGDIWRVLCLADPDRALRGLKAEAAASSWNASAWGNLLSVAAEKDDAELQAALAQSILGIPDPQLAEFLPSATSWLQRKRVEVSTQFLPFWDQMARLAYPVTEEPGTTPGESDDLLSEALNRPGGVLAWSLLDYLGATNPVVGAGLSGDLAARFDTLMVASGRPGLLARLLLVEMLAYLNSIAPDWSSQNIVPRLAWSHTEAPALWHAYARGRVGSATLFNALKGAYLAAFERHDVRDDDLDSLAHTLFSIGLWHRHGNGQDYNLTDADIKRVLTIGPATVRKHVSWILWRIMDGAEDNAAEGADTPAGSKVERWDQIVGPLFAEIWPLDANLRDESTSQNLVHMAMDSGEAFPAVVEAIRDLVVPYKLYELAYSLRFGETNGAHVQGHPLAFLRLANTLIDPDVHPVPRDLSGLLADCLTTDPSVATDPAYTRLLGLSKLTSA